MLRNRRTALKKLVTACALGLSLSLTAPVVAQAKEKFILAHAYPSDHIFHQTSETFQTELNKQQSELAISYHPGGDLGDWTSLFEQSMQGVIPMTITFGASEFDDRLDLSWLGFVVDNWDDARRIYGPGGEIVGIYDEILADLDLKALGTIPTGFGSLAIRKGIGKQPTNFPADAKGIKMRVPPVPVAIDRFKNWGFNAIPMPYSELYTSLQLGTVDGRAFGPAVEIWQMRDVLESYVLTRDYFEHAFWLVNKSWYEDLSAKDRAALDAAADKTLESIWSEAQAIDDGFLSKVRDAGINVVELSKEERAKAKRILYANEWPMMEKKVGKPIMDKIRTIAGVK